MKQEDGDSGDTLKSHDISFESFKRHQEAAWSLVPNIP